MTALHKTIAAAVQKYVGLRRRLQRREARAFTQRTAPELLRAYDEFAAASQSGVPRQPFKGRELWRVLEAVRPRSIVELGSGTTSAVFALWARRTNACYAAFEHDPHWAEVTAQCLRRAGLADGVAPVRHVPMRVREDQAATGFIEPISAMADFVYVDGPPCRLHTGVKVPNDDVTRLLDGGGRPAVIVVDGRVETVDAIRRHAASSQYRFEPSFVYSMRRGLWRSALAAREHTLFLKR